MLGKQQKSLGGTSCNGANSCKTAGVGSGARREPFAAPAIAQSMPELKWRLTSSFPKSLDTLYGAAEIFAKTVADADRQQVPGPRVRAGEIVPACRSLDAVQNSTVEMGHTAGYYYVGKDPTFAFDTGVPFGLTARQQNAWMTAGRRPQLMREFYDGLQRRAVPAGNTGAQMGGWFRKEIKTLDDLKGLKMRIAGIGGQVWAKLGAVPQQIAGGDIYPALEKGTIDAAEWVGPYDDEKLGFNKVAPYYYYPGWWEGGHADLAAHRQAASGTQLPPGYKTAVETAAADVNGEMLARTTTLNPQALAPAGGGGRQVAPYPREVLAAACEGDARALRRNLEQECQVQEGLRNWRPSATSSTCGSASPRLTYENFAFTAGQTVK